MISIMFRDFIAARNVSQKWKYERRSAHTYTRDHLVNVLNYYKDLNYFSSSCLVIGTDATGTNAYFASVCMKTSLEATEYIQSILNKGFYKQDEYRSDSALMDLDTGSFNARTGISL